MTETTSTSRAKRLRLMEAALDLYQVGENERALDLLQQVTRQAPDLAIASLTLGLVYQAKGESTIAEAAFRRAIELEPGNEQARNALGMLLIQQGQIEEGGDLLKTVLQTSPDNQDALDGLVTASLKANQPEQAEEALCTAWLATHHPDIGVKYTRFLLTQNKIDEAYQVIQEAARYVQTPKVLIELSLLLVVQKKYDQAVETLKKIIQLDPNSDRAWRGLAHCYTQLGDVHRALEHADRALAIPTPKYPYRNWQAKGEALLAAGRYPDALEAAQKGIALIDPEDPEAQPVLAVLYMQRVNAFLALKNIDAALDELRKARKALPADGTFYLHAIDLCLQKDCLDDAINVVEEALNVGLAPEEQWVRIGYQLLHHHNKSDQALDFAARMVELNPSHLDVLESTGVDFYTKDQPKMAQAVFEQLLRLNPQNLRLHTNLSYILIGEQKFQQANSHLEAVFTGEADSEDLYYQHIALCNLGYLCILENRLNEAQASFTKVLASSRPDETAFLRVAFWKNERFIPDYAPHAARSATLVTAAKANLAALALQRGENEPAAALAKEIISAEPGSSLGYEVLGCVLFMQGTLLEAREAWQEALERTEDAQERALLQGWIAA